MIRRQFLAALLLSLGVLHAGDHRAVGGDALSVSIDVGRKGEPINPFIYGQFIEHLGRCVYGGIWAEMLEDRKFFFPVTDEYDPYKSLRDSKFPVVGASPWEVLGPAGSVTMCRQDPFVGDHTPVLAAGSGIRQNDLGVVADKGYIGYAWLVRHTGDPAVTVSLVWGDAADQRQTIGIDNVGSEYAKHAFQFTAKGDTEKARLEIRVTGGSCCVGAVSLMPEDNVRGMRADTLALLRQLNAPMYRWPGGNFVSGYDWRDGIGPRDRRPPRQNPAWTGVEHNDMGIDEFIAFCREVGAEPLIAANTGFGDAYSAAQEVEYCNGTADTLGGSWRATNGHAEPYTVRYWCVGNEMFGPWQLGFMQLKHYTEKHNRVARAMLKADPNLELIGVGDLGRVNRKNDPDEQRGWSRGMLQQCADSMDYLSEHFYIWNVKEDTTAHVAQMVDAIRGKAQGHRELQAELANLDGRIVPIAMDEWNYWYRQYEYGELGCVYRLRDTLGVAAGLHEFFRNSDIIQMAHYAQTVNVIGCIKTTKTDAFLSATALPLMLYRQQFGVTPLAVTGDYDPAAVDVSAALTADGRTLTIGVVNTLNQPRTIAVTFESAKAGDRATVWRIAGDDPAACNTVESQEVVIEGPREIAFDGNLTLPAYSVNLYRVPLP
jgi:alpha-N-arabinofuranosidase